MRAYACMRARARVCMCAGVCAGVGIGVGMGVVSDIEAAH